MPLNTGTNGRLFSTKKSFTLGTVQRSFQVPQAVNTLDIHMSTLENTLSLASEPLVCQSSLPPLLYSPHPET
jgi:hypothetical protein